MNTIKATLETFYKNIPAMDKDKSGGVDQTELKTYLKNKPNEGINFLTKERNNYRNELCTFCAHFARTVGTKLFTCGAGKFSGCVDAYGNLQPCFLLRAPETQYDLKKGTLKDGRSDAVMLAHYGLHLYKE
jgi:hypothetical protein